MLVKMICSRNRKHDTYPHLVVSREGFGLQLRCGCKARYGEEYVDSGSISYTWSGCIQHAMDHYQVTREQLLDETNKRRSAEKAKSVSARADARARMLDHLEQRNQRHIDRHGFGMD